jgi:hypothetical protein
MLTIATREERSPALASPLTTAGSPEEAPAASWPRTSLRREAIVRNGRAEEAKKASGGRTWFPLRQAQTGLALQ